MGLEVIKNYLHVDFEDDDEYINLLIDVAKEYITDAIGKYDETIARHKLLLLNIISTLYEKRQYTVDKSNEKVAYALHSMVMQLQLGDLDE